MPATTSRRPARYETPFGHGILDDEGRWENVQSLFCNVGSVTPRDVLDGFLRSHNGYEPWPLESWDAATMEFRSKGRLFRVFYAGLTLSGEKWEVHEFLPALPPLSGGSDAATAEAEVHHGDDYCPECGEFHEPQARYGQVVPSPISRRPGPDDLDVAHEMGRCAFLSDRRPVLAPMGLSDAEWDAFYRGVEAGERENHARLMDLAMRAEVDAEMEVCRG
jgi:hypothetical protein